MPIIARFKENCECVGLILTQNVKQIGSFICILMHFVPLGEIKMVNGMVLNEKPSTQIYWQGVCQS